MKPPDDLNETEIEMLRRDQCPECSNMTGFQSGPRGGAAQNIFCHVCGAGFNVGMPRFIVFAQRIGRREP